MQQKSNLPSITKSGLQIAKNTDNSLATMNLVIEEGNPEYWYEKATRAKTQEDWEAAFYFYSKAVQLSNKENKYLIPKAYCAMKINKTEIASHSLKQAFKYRKDWDVVESFRSLLISEEWDNLRTYFNLLNSPDHSILFTIALLEYPGEYPYYCGDRKKALNILNSIIGEEKNLNSDFFDLRGFLHQILNDFISSKNDFDALAGLEPDNARAYFCRGYASHEIARDELACSEKYYWNKLELADSALKGFKLAIKDFTTCIELDPEFVGAYLHRGDIYLELKEFRLATNDYTTYIEFDTKNANAYLLRWMDKAYLNRGKAYYNLKEFSLAIQDFAKAIELDDSNKRGEAAYLLDCSEKELKLINN